MTVFLHNLVWKTLWTHIEPLDGFFFWQFYKEDTRTSICFLATVAPSNSLIRNIRPVQETGPRTVRLTSSDGQVRWSLKSIEIFHVSFFLFGSIIFWQDYGIEVICSCLVFFMPFILNSSVFRPFRRTVRSSPDHTLAVVFVFVSFPKIYCHISYLILWNMILWNWIIHSIMWLVAIITWWMMSHLIR